MVENLILTSNGRELNFEKVNLIFKQETYQDVFAGLRNKTVDGTLENPKYIKLKQLIKEGYPKYLDWKIGDFLLELKQHGDDNYKLFLNPYGDLVYSIFKITDPRIMYYKGLYAYGVYSELKYIGRTVKNFEDRINSGHGRISPKNCYLGGQSTNCHKNSLVTENRDSVSLWICILEDNSEILTLEHELIATYNPEWNLKLG